MVFGGRRTVLLDVACIDSFYSSPSSFKNIHRNIIGSVILRAIYYYPAPDVPQAVLTQYCVDAFAVGGLLAYKYTTSDKERLAISKYFNMALYAGIPFGVIIILTRSEYLSFVFNRLLFAMISMKVVQGAVTGYKSYFGKFLQNKAVLYLARISYGIYLYHLVLPFAFWKLYDATYNYFRMYHAAFVARHQQGINAIEKIIISEWFYFFICAGLVIGIAALSSVLIKKPVNKLKVSFNFDIRKPTLKPLNEQTT